MADKPTLLERIGTGDREAVSLCIDRYSGLVWSLARRFLDNEADAEEAVQDIFMEVWASAGRYRPDKASETTFVSMLARRRLIDRVRRLEREPRRATLKEAESGRLAGGHEALEASAEIHRVLEVIRDLQPDQQQVLRMSAWLGLSHGAIAERTGMPLGTVKSNLRRGLLKIREVLGETQPSPGGASS